jgi:phosphate transport system protein
MQTAIVVDPRRRGRMSEKERGLRHFDEELEDLQKLLLEMGGLVEAAIRRATTAISARDASAAQEVIRNEARINQLEIEIDDFAVRLLALHQPMAKDLRFLTAAIKINNDLERIGDLAVNIVERSLSLAKRAPIRPAIDIPQMARLVDSMIRNSLDAFLRRDVELAREVLAADDAVDEQRTRAYSELVAYMQDDPASIPSALDLIFVARNLERIADHATNVAEDVLYLVQGIDVRHHAEVNRAR